MTSEQLTGALTTVESAVTSAFSIVTGNSLLIALFSATLLMVAFKIIKRARNAVD